MKKSHLKTFEEHSESKKLKHISNVRENKPYSDINTIKQNGFTIGDLKRMIKGLDDETPVLLVNPVDRGSNQFVAGNIKIDDVIISDDGIAYTTNMTHIAHFVKTKGLLIYEG